VKSTYICRRHCWLRHRKPSCDSRPRPAHPHTRGGPYNLQRSSAQAPDTLPNTPRTRLKHSARTREPPKRRTRRMLGNRAYRAVSRRWRQCELYVHLQIPPPTPHSRAVVFGTRKKE
jgi:hypothetical protein